MATAKKTEEIIDSFCERHHCSLGCPIRSAFPNCGSGFYVGYGDKAQKAAAIKIIEAEQILEKRRNSHGGD